MLAEREELEEKLKQQHERAEYQCNAKRSALARAARLQTTIDRLVQESEEQGQKQATLVAALARAEAAEEQLEGLTSERAQLRQDLQRANNREVRHPPTCKMRRPLVLRDASERIIRTVAVVPPRSCLCVTIICVTIHN